MEVLWILMGLIGGGSATFFIQKSLVKTKSEGLIKEAELQAEIIRKEKALQAKENFLRLKEEHESAIKDRERKLQSNEDRARAKEKNIDQKIEELGRKEKITEGLQNDFDAKFQGLAVRMQELDKIQAYMELKYPEAYCGGLKDLEVNWVPVGARFRIDEYDGAESLVLESEQRWMTA